MSYFDFGPASENEGIVFGAQRPGYPSHSVSIDSVKEWLSFMGEQGIKHVCCLLPQDQLQYYDQDLLETYRQEYGQESVCWAPVNDFHLIEANMLIKQVLPFLAESREKCEPVVVHCSGGIGRTGHVLAAWLVFGCGFSPHEALDTTSKMGRNAREAVQCGYATEDALIMLLQRYEKLL